MEPLTAVGLIVAVFLLLAVIIAQVDGLAFMAPKSTRALRGAAARTSSSLQVRSSASRRGTPSGSCP